MTTVLLLNYMHIVRPLFYCFAACQYGMHIHVHLTCVALAVAWQGLHEELPQVPQVQQVPYMAQGGMALTVRPGRMGVCWSDHMGSG